MNVLTHDETREVSGGMIGGGTTRGGVPLYDAAATREPGQNSYGETTPGGAAFFENAMTMANLQQVGDTLLTNQANSCAAGNLLVCVVDTFQVLNNRLDQAARRNP